MFLGPTTVPSGDIDITDTAVTISFLPLMPFRSAFYSLNDPPDSDQLESTMINCNKSFLAQRLPQWSWRTSAGQWGSNSPRNRAKTFMFWSDYRPDFNWSYCKFPNCICVKPFFSDLHIQLVTPPRFLKCSSAHLKPQFLVVLLQCHLHICFFSQSCRNTVVWPVTWEPCRLTAVLTVWFPVLKPLTNLRRDSKPPKLPRTLPRSGWEKHTLVI